MSVLEIRNLHAKVADSEILKGVNLTLHSGEIHAVMGPNGSGKSTLAYVIAGHPHYEVTEGDILLDGESILEMEADERSRAGLFLAFQYPVAVPGVSVANFLRTAVSNVRGYTSQPAEEGRAGMDAFVAKPFAVDELIAAILRLTGARPEATPPPAAPEPPAAPPGLEMLEALKVWRDPAVYQRFLAKFARDNADCAQRLRELLAQGEVGQAGALAHKIKGSAGNLSLPALARAAEVVEHRLMEGGDASGDVASLQQAFDEACLAIQALNGEAPVMPKASPTPGDGGQLQALLDELVAALDRDNPDLAVPVLDRLQGLLPEAPLARLRERVDDFDFRGAEQAARDLIAEQAGQTGTQRE